MSRTERLAELWWALERARIWGRHRRRRVQRRRDAARVRLLEAVQRSQFRDAHDRWALDAELRAYEGDETW